MSGIVSGTFSSQEKKKNIMEQNASHVNATIFGLKPVLTTKVITTDTVNASRLKLGPDTMLHTSHRSIIILTSDFNDYLLLLSKNLGFSFSLPMHPYSRH